MSEEPVRRPEDEPEGRAGGARLMSELRQAQARAERAEREVERTKRSASYVVGNLLVQAAKDPRRLLVLPRDLWRVWRLRKARRTAPTTGGSTVRARDVLDLDAARLLIPRLAAVPAGGGLSIAGAIGTATARGWMPYAALSPAMPHEAAALVEAVDPDIVIIDTSASLPGEAWAHLGDPAAVDRLLAAGALVDAAHALGKPAVLLRMTPPSHTALLDGLAHRCDVVLDGPGSSTRGARWHPGIDPFASVPLPDGLGLLDLASRADVDLAVTRRVTLDPALPPDSAWQRALGAATGVIASPVPIGIIGAGLLSVASLAAGRRLLAPGDEDIAGMLRPWPEAQRAALVTRDPGQLSRLAASGPEPLSQAEQRGALAAILLAAAAPVQLTYLAEKLGIESRPRSRWDVALVADPAPEHLATYIDRVLAQSWRPREVVVDTPLPGRAHAALAEAGIDVVHVDEGTPRDPALMGLTSPFIAEQVDLDNPHDIVDLLAGLLLDQPPRSHPTDARVAVAR